MLPLLGGLDRAVVIDAGACVGAWSRAWLGVFAARTERLYLFEPQREARIHLDGADLFSAAERGRMEIVPKALARHTGLRDFYADEPGSSLASLYSTCGSGWGFMPNTVSSVEAIALDDFARLRGLSRIDVMKLDVEGAEYEILQGATSLLEAQKIGVVLFEFGAPHVHSRTFFRDIWQLLLAAGYRIARISAGNCLEYLPEYSYDLERFDLVQMFVGYPRSYGVTADRYA